VRILLLTTDAFGGHGGIAQYNRNLLVALSAMPDVKEIVAIPRHASFPVGNLPPKLTYHIEAIGGKARYFRTVLKVLGQRFDLVICGHVNLLSLAWLASIRSRAPLVLSVHGIDVWQPHESMLIRILLRQIDAVWSVSKFTQDKMAAWAKVAVERFHILPNTINLDLYGMAHKEPALVEQYGLRDHKVMMILARLASAERYKGVDELLEIMPDLLVCVPELAFLVAGNGDDRARLERKAKELGISDQVVFAGYIPESQKAAHLRLADAFVMPGRGEGFGIVLLEAMACGIPVVASTLDGSSEAVRSGMLGQVVNPDDRTALAQAITRALNTKKGIPEGLEYFSFANFQSRVQALVTATISN
jgi:phosphatidyl-myo-inositol dimannoside synthase